jgi:hypothetical protein
MITLSRGATSIDIDKALDFERTTGRDQDVVRRNPNANDPRGIQKRKAATDEFSFSAELVGPNAYSRAVTLRDDIILPPLQRNSLTLDFNGTYGLNQYSVFPFGSNSVRIMFPAGSKDTVILPDLTLRVVDNS